MNQDKAGEPLLQVIGLHKRFTGVHALRGVTLSFSRGQIYHLLGENGCGKSTLIKIISGAQPPDEGELVIEGRRYARLAPLQALAAGIETVYQDLSLLPNMSVAENVALTAELAEHDGRLARTLDRRVLAGTAARALAAVGLPGDAAFQSTLVEQLPLATRQLVAIARAIASEAKFVIMDEPTTSLTQKEVANLIEVLGALRAQGVTVLFVSHKLDECYAIGGEVIVLRDGQKVAQGPIADYTKAQLSSLMTGRELSQDRYRHAAPQAEVVLEVRGLSRRAQFRDISFALRRGEILGVTGLLDSGRNELARALAGVSPADAGEIVLDGRPIALATPADAKRHRIGYVPEDRLSEGLFLDKSIRENVITAMISSLRDRLGQIDRKRSRALAEATVKELQIATPDIEKPVQSLSGGNQQRVLIGRWLAIDPRVLILHGPTVGVDVGSKDIIYRIMQQLSQRGIAILLISDDLPELLQNSDRILMMKKGSLAGEYDASGLAEADLYRALLSEAHEGQRMHDVHEAQR
ncbi:sugar ABC transporter ATP-binding protein [Trinickia caryophylli]|uniref:Monosaccharide ABC transporter ATP-binding protein, CUT2 family n=1 Tax=Trinickia caryophylli TaxID=28094 RepID=A0A1X7EUN5_TRICW|nr:sugar ABC transporter ATP-binding protein [Trinickia caryophylli]PMS12167.1 sugar ABC transporter ATP-binding protein [Trinickia caryophylli]TRX18525.1 sugar ABC transporter ATP-binding protein [Trinickia caryophylli]WQE10685.1 sugar ABC transporter ATP-binding protein [Trinickia caryophylli]SMF40263.1 monosaccharide ABC transporter ATP-binding protein, CUT2 family [Trinickia caryophylli]GLU33055.1 sugar ABC transporter ATP-binding protein [Trinickia caryophylli]